MKKVKDKQNKTIPSNPFVGDPVAYKYITFYSGGTLQRVLCIEEGKDGSCYVWHLPKTSGRKIAYHNNRGQSMPPYQRHHYGAGYHKIPDSISYTQKFITEYKDSPFSVYHWGGKNVGGELIKTITSHDIVFNLDKFNFDSFELALFSDHRSELAQSEWANAEGKMVLLKTFNLVASMLYRNKPHKLSHKTSIKSSK